MVDKTTHKPLLAVQVEFSAPVETKNKAYNPSNIVTGINSPISHDENYNSLQKRFKLNEKETTNTNRIETSSDCVLPSRAIQSKTVETLVEQAKSEKYSTHYFAAISTSWYSMWKQYTQAKEESKHPGPLTYLKESDMNEPVKKIAKLDTEYVLLPYNAWKILQSWYNDKCDEPIANPLVLERSKSNALNILEEELDMELQRMGAKPCHWSKDWNVPGLKFDANVCFVCQEEDAEFACPCNNVSYCSKGCQAAHWKFHRKVCNKKIKSKRQWNNTRFGITGINNLGNTCFMSSATQCLSHTWPLTRYFLRKDFRLDVNHNSVFGTGGTFSTVWFTLLQQLWLGTAASVKPEQLKIAIGDLPGSANQFQGYMQHDAQELLTFLLDTLHEDLNLVSQKPYIPNDENTAKCVELRAAEAWIGNWKRDKSIISFLFQGQSQSTLECPACQHQSITFEPFISLPLAIPKNTTRVITIDLIRIIQKGDNDNCFVAGNTDNPCRTMENGAATQAPFQSNVIGISHPNSVNPVVPNASNNDSSCFPVAVAHVGNTVRYAIEVDDHDTIYDLKVKLGKLCGIKPKNFWITELDDGYLSAQHYDNASVKVLSTDIVYIAYELQPKRTDTGYVVVLHGSKDTVLGIPSLVQISKASQLSNLYLSIKEIIQQSSTLSNKIHATTLDETSVVSTVVTNDGSSKDQHENPIVYDQSAIETLFEEDATITFIKIDWNEDGIIGDRFFDESSVYNYVNDESVSQLASRSRHGTSVSLHTCLQNFLHKEKLDEGNTWYCSNCKKNERAWKSISIRRLPEIIIVFLKRFEHDETFQIGKSKINDLVLFPETGLDMGTYVGLPPGQMCYDLYAVINHYGSMGHGHYTSFVESNGVWYEIDDKTPNEIEGEICTSAAYVLFYRRKSN